MAMKSTLAGVLAGLTLLAAGMRRRRRRRIDGDAGRCHRRDERRRRRPPSHAGRDDGDTGQDDRRVASPRGDVPQRIVSLSPTHTEMLFAIGAGDQVSPSTTSPTTRPRRPP